MSRAETIGGFQRLKEVGAGAQAKVWKAKCVDDIQGIVPKGSIVALKIKNEHGSDLDAVFDKLKRRVDELKSMNHQNVVRYLGCFRVRGREDERHVVVQEYLEGETLKERLAKRRLGLDVDEGLRIVREAADGLRYTSGLKIFHRDIKPGNIFLCEDGTVKLIDFGVAKQDGETVDGSSNIRGTFNYMAPDFMSPTFSGDQQSDIFSLGVVMHEIISGKLPYVDGAGSDWQGWMSRWRQWTEDMEKGDSPIFVHAMAIRLLNGAYEVLEKALEANRSKRYADFDSFRQDLDTITFYEQKHGDRTYRRLQFVGKGGFGEVFKARWVEKNIDVAVKQLLNADYATRFRTEAKVMQELQDPCFVKFIDFFETSDHAFLVMKFLDGMPGSSLRDAINRFGQSGIPKSLVLPAFERYARGLSLMHRRKIIHRDIKPSNLYYPAGRPDLVAIMDFGIVKEGDSSFTSGMVPCTFDYAPPEIAVTNDRGGPGMDIYALGLCMYEALTGRQGYPRIPTGTAGMMTFFERCKSKKEPNFDDPRVTGDRDLLALLRKMTAPNLSDRYVDADKVAIEIRKLFYRDTFDDDCPPTQIFNPQTDKTLPIDEKRLMEWYKEWVKSHPEAKETPVVAAQEPPASGRWMKLVVTAFVSACVSIGGMFMAQQVWHIQLPVLKIWHDVSIEPVTASSSSEPVSNSPAPEELDPKPSTPEHGPETATPESAPVPPAPDPMILELKRQLFERDFAAAVADEPVESRRTRIAAGADRLAQAKEDGLYDNSAKLAGFEKTLEEASAAVVGKIENACGCALTVDGLELDIGETRLFRFADGMSEGRQMRIFGHEVRFVPEDLDGRTVKVRKSDFAVSDVEVASPSLDDGVECRFAGATVTGILMLKPGDYMCEYLRRGYETQSIPFTVELGHGRTLPSPGSWEPSPVEVSLPKLESGVAAIFDGKVVTGSLKLLPGSYMVEYQKKGHISQSRDFDVKLAEPRSLPLPGEWEVLPEPVPEPPTPEPAPVPSAPDPMILELKRLLFERDFAAAVADEPVESRRTRIAAGADRLAQAKEDGLYDDAAKLAGFEKTLEEASTAVVGKIKNACGCALTVDGLELDIGETRLFRFADGKSGGRQMRIFGYEVRAVPEGLDGRTIEVSKSDFVVSDVEVVLPSLDDGVECRFEGAKATGSLMLKPGDYMCEYLRRGYETQSIPFTVELGRGRTLPSPGAWMPSLVEVSLPKLESGVAAIFDGKVLSGSLKLLPGSYMVEYQKKGHISQSRDFDVKLAEPRTLPLPGEWKTLPEPVSVTKKSQQSKPTEISPEIRRLLSDAKFYYDDGDYELTVKNFHVAFVKGYRLDANDMTVFESAYKKRRDFLRGRIEYLEKQEFRKTQNLRDIEEHREKLRQLGEWYRAVKQGVS